MADLATATRELDASRLHWLDLLRGSAVLGIFWVNVFLFAWPETALERPRLWLADDTVGWWSWAAMHVLAEQKFINLLALVFGMSLALSDQRHGTAEADARQRRRMTVLAILGLLHAWLLWWGDILFTYACAGMLAWWLRHRPAHQLLTLGVLLYAVPALMMLVLDLAGFWHADTLPAPNPADWAAEIALYQNSWWAQMAHRAPTALLWQTTGLITAGLWHALGLMLIGLALVRLRLWAQLPAARHWPWSLVVAGALLMTVSAYWLGQSDELQWRPLLLAFQAQYWGSPLMTAGYAWLLYRWFLRGSARNLQDRLCTVGQLALSVYLLQSVLATLLFYGHGLGLFGQLQAIELLLVALGMTWLWLWLCPLWRRHLGTGPAERLWRYLAHYRMKE